MDDGKSFYLLAAYQGGDYVHQLNGFTGSMAKHSLSDCWKNRRAFIVKHNGFLHTSIPRQCYEGTSWTVMLKGH
jgi:hypothetical protein